MLMARAGCHYGPDITAKEQRMRVWFQAGYLLELGGSLILLMCK